MAVARALCVANGDAPDECVSGKPLWLCYMSMAQAAIAVVRSHKETPQAHSEWNFTADDPSFRD